ncbi:diguanylate cyclase [Kineococcus sp. NBC_00420]|uniref:diguanylate cyclase n=1 Tax=Kineococcus sp. NBC_00420 TaxID=2903564 RepID=UPI002E1C4EE6
MGDTSSIRPAGLEATGPAPHVPGPAPAPGPTIPPDPLRTWTVLRELGRGAGSVVHLAARADVREPGGREYAIKRQRHVTLPPLDQVEADRTLRREAALLASVHHPGLTRVHAVEQVEGRLALVMDAHDGTSLADLLHTPPTPGRPGRGGDAVPASTAPLSLTTSLRLAVDVCDALHALHRNGLVHRDVKPANVLVTRAGRAVLVDLGVAHLENSAPVRPGVHPPGERADGPERRREEDRGGADAASETEVGALHYRSPEQAGVVRSPVDHRSDLYSVGALLLECLTGRTPVEGSDPTQVRRRLGRLRPLDPAVLGPDVPRALGVLLRRLLALDPEDRPASAAAVADELSRIAAGTAPDVALGRRSWVSPADGPLLERGQQTAVLDAAWDTARAGSGGVVVVRGAAGSGRSSLVEHLHRRAGGQGAAAVVLDSTTSPASPLSALRRAMTAGGLSTPPRDGAVSGDGDEQRPQALAEELLQHAARTGPLLVVLDDTEHADASTLAVLRWVAGECADLPLLLVLVDRPRESGGLDPALDSSRTLVIDVPALSDAAARAVVRRRLPGAVLTDSVASALVSRAAGNPGALLALLTALLDDGGLLPDWGHWRLEQAALEAVPVAPGLLAALLRRVEELPAGHRNVLRLAAACGRSVDDHLVLRAASPQLPAEAVRAGLAAGVAVRLLRPRPHGRHEFLHQQVVDAVLDGLDEVERRGLHARLARVLRVDTRAGTECTDREAVFACAHQHLRAGDAVAPADVVAACAVAGVSAARHFAPEAAVGLLQQAVETADGAGLPLDPRLRRLLASCLARTGRHAWAHDHLDHLLRTTTDPLGKAVGLGEIATLHRHERAPGGPARALDAAREGLAQLGSSRPGTRAAWWVFTVVTVAGFVATLLDPRRRRASRHRLDSPREVEENTAEAAHAVLLREAAATDLDRGYPLTALPTALASIAHALRGRRADLARDGRRTLAAALRRLLTGRATLLPVRLPGTSSLVGRPLTPPSPRRGETEPSVQAGIRLAEGLDRLRSGGTWREVAQVLEDDGQWLDLPEYVAGTRAVVLERLAAGHLAAARSWHDRALRRVPEGAPVPVDLDLLRVALLGACGRPGEAGELLTRVRGGLSATSSPEHQLAVHLATVTWLVQQLDLSERFDEVARRSTALLHRSPLRRSVEARWTADLVVRGRLAQLAAATDAGDTVRVREREQELREALGHPAHRAGGAVQEAQFDVVRAAAWHRLGRSHRAKVLRRRAERCAARLDAPLVQHHLMLLRAEDLEASGAFEDAERLHWLATALADRHGWATLVQRGRADLNATQPAGSGTWGPAAGRRRRLLSAMRDVGDAAQVLDPQDVVRLALDQACGVLGADRAVLAVLDGEDELVVFAGRTRSGTDLALGTPLDPAAVRAARTGRPVVRGVLDAQEQRSAHTPEDVARSVVAVPLLVRGRRTGVLAAVSTVAQGAFGRGDVELLQLIAGQVAASLETARAARLEIEVHGAQRERDLAEAVRRLTEEVSGSLDLPTVRRRLLRSALTELRAGRAALVPVAVRSTVDVDPPALVTAAGGTAVREVPWSRDRQGDRESAPLLERPLAAHGGDPLPARLRGLLDLGGDGGTGEERWLVVPLKDRTGLVAEALVLVGGPEGPAARLHVAEALAAPAAIGLENARLFAQVEHLARTDSLTGLATRGHLLRLGEQRVRRATPGRAVAVLMVDVDHFKSVNDTFGHAAGDEVLTAVARRLQHEARESDVLGRYGGEEFALVVTSPAPEEGSGPLEAREVAERLRLAVRRSPVLVRGEQLQVTVSVGVALLREGEQLSDVLARADSALYRAKAAGRDAVVEAL